MEPKQLPDLVVGVQKGDLPAFHELVTIYREQAIRWALRVVRDPHLAEDVVQEAFIQMKGKIGTLREPGNFHSWFRQVVRRTAINQIRGASSGTTPAGHAVELLGQTEDLSEWYDPLHSLLSRERQTDLLTGSLGGLPEQSRSLLTSYALEEATPDELAVRFGMKKSNVYNVLSRSRTKANEERFRKEVDRHLAERRQSGLPRSGELPVPEYERPYALISILIAEVLRTAGEPDWSLTELMGISGDAFRLNVTARCEWQGIATFDWSYSAYQALERLGLSGTCLGRPGPSPLSPERQISLLSVIQETIDRGLPAIVWNLAINEFGLLYAYNDDDRTIRYAGYNRRTSLFSYEQLGRAHSESALFLLAIGRRTGRPVSGDAILPSVMRHIRGQEPPVPGFAFGLPGYRLWMEAAQDERLDLQGHAYQVAILCEARQQGHLFLQGLSEKAKSTDRRIGLARASACFLRASEAFAGMYPSFPFGYGGSHANRLSHIREGLLAAWEAEKEALAHLETYKA
ncbi:hypothetical protein J31TS4_40480 [Paenibacillus sp. J31TS4]|uniref:RNA polymerase sigma factor n=1 Tax=Paenibacillus sp. J31TS4 TaxID=2807195 RepID=UPI001B05DB55|nr:sigma-70 family RNA polymerase sigma factor [Paenibacillus sp. J31TS4]GIP40768.1 hypothetical protein J31TS4_40480 [Paenibacillus sp. J31TS4]